MKESQDQTDDMVTQNTTIGVPRVTLPSVHCERWWRPARESPAHIPAKVSLVASY